MTIVVVINSSQWIEILRQLKSWGHSLSCMVVQITPRISRVEGRSSDLSFLQLLISFMMRSGQARGLFNSTSLLLLNDSNSCNQQNSDNKVYALHLGLLKKKRFSTVNYMNIMMLYMGRYVINNNYVITTYLNCVLLAIKWLYYALIFLYPSR